jgi:hypothetical protein
VFDGLVVEVKCSEAKVHEIGPRLQLVHGHLPTPSAAPAQTNIGHARALFQHVVPIHPVVGDRKAVKIGVKLGDVSIEQ